MSLGLKGLSWHFIADSEIQFFQKNDTLCYRECCSPGRPEAR